MGGTGPPRCGSEGYSSRQISARGFGVHSVVASNRSTTPSFVSVTPTGAANGASIVRPRTFTLKRYWLGTRRNGLNSAFARRWASTQRTTPAPF